MANIRVCRLHKTNDEEVLKAQSPPFRTARLKSLQSDPASFRSKYESEVDQPIEFWIDRLRPAHVQHFMLIDLPEADIHFEGSKSAQGVNLRPDVQIMGFMVVINTSEAARTQKPDAHEMEMEKKDNPEGLETYWMAALWIDPSLRGQQFARKIIEASIGWMKEDAKARSLRKVRYRTTALQGNNRAVKVYEKNGFVVMDAHVKGEDDGDNVYVEMYQDLVVEE